MSLPEFIYTVLLKPGFLKKTANWALKKIIPPKTNVGSAVVYLNPNDPVISGALALHVFESDEIKLFKRLFRPEMTFLDVGANVGLYSAIALSTNNFSGKIICVEPHNESRLYLEQTLAANKGELSDINLILSAAAVSDFHGTALLHNNPQNKGDNRLYADALLEDSESVAVTTIDKICLDNNIDKINFIKIDVQGAEGKAIAGASNILERSNNCIILSELWPYGLSQYGSDIYSYLSLLESLKFTLFKLEKKGLLSPLDVDEIAKNYRGRKYTNIVGAKGQYLEMVELIES